MDILKLNAINNPGPTNSYLVEVYMGTDQKTNHKQINEIPAEKMNKIFSIDLTNQPDPFYTEFTEDFGTDQIDDADKYSWGDKLNIIIRDPATMTSMKAGICIKDTPYPPPYSSRQQDFVTAHQLEDFSSIYISTLVLTKKDDDFTIRVDLKMRDNSNFLLKPNGIELFYDDAMEQHVLVLFLKTVPNQGTNVIKFDYPNQTFSLYLPDTNRNDGIPVVLYLGDPADPMVWSDITKKKALILIK